MNYKDYINYYKKNDNLKLIGGGLLIVGLFMIWLGLFYGFGILFIPAGLAMFIVGSVGRASEADIDKYIAMKTEGMEVNLTEDNKYRKRILEHIPPHEIAGHEYPDGVMLKKAKDSSIRSSKYTKAIFYLLSDELYIVKRTFSIISDEVENETVEIPYASLSNVEIVRERGTKKDGKKSFLVKETTMKISYGEGEVFTTPIHDDITSDNFANQILKLVSEFKKSNTAAE